MPSSQREIIGDNLRALIQDRGYRTIELFCHENGINKGWFSRVLNGETDPSLSRAIKIAEALGATLSDIYPGKPLPKSRK